MAFFNSSSGNGTDAPSNTRGDARKSQGSKPRVIWSPAISSAIPPAKAKRCSNSSTPVRNYIGSENSSPPSFQGQLEQIQLVSTLGHHGCEGSENESRDSLDLDAIFNIKKGPSTVSPRRPLSSVQGSQHAFALDSKENFSEKIAANRIVDARP